MMCIVPKRVACTHTQIGSEDFGKIPIKESYSLIYYLVACCERHLYAYAYGARRAFFGRKGKVRVHDEGA